MLAIHAVPAFKDNYIWMLVEGRHAAAVDPGEAAPVQQFLDAHGLKLTAVLATHHHADHVGGVPALVQRWKCPTFGPAREVAYPLDRRLREAETFEVPGVGVTLSTLDIPGHTAGHIALTGDGLLFCGDTLFGCGCGRLFEGTPQQMNDSLGKLARLPEETRVHCGHEYTLANLRFAQAVEPGNPRLAERYARDSAKRERDEPTVPSTIADERATNPFLRCHEPEVITAAQRRAGRELRDAVAVFAELREWKNHFA